MNNNIAFNAVKVAIAIYCIMSLACVCRANDVVSVTADTAGVCSRFISASETWAGAPSLSFSNPALMPWRSSCSSGAVSAGYSYRCDSRAVVAGLGDGSAEGFFDAKAYIRSGASVLWGKAEYRNGKRRNVQFNEGADYEKVYPYIMADEIGGDLKLEVYSFGGGYAHRRGAWAYGGTLAYDAGLYYRDVDPRPRVVTGNLAVSAGAAHDAFSGYAVGLSARFERYTQSCNISFLSEMGESKIYHLTGLGTHYVRFDGAGKTSARRGYTYGLSLNLFPVSSGAFVSAEVSRMTLDYIIRDLNQLPMAELWQNTLRVQVGWRAGAGRNRWAVQTNLKASRRHGIENIFGDAASSVYPQIASHEMYACNCFDIGLSGLYERYFSTRMRTRLSVLPSVAYMHVRQVHVLPFCMAEVNNVFASLHTEVYSMLSGRTAGMLSLGVSFRQAAGGCGINLGEVPDTDVDRAMAGVVRSDYDIAVSRCVSMQVGAGFLYALGERYALGLDVSYRHDYYALPIRTDGFNTMLRLYF